MIKRNFNGGGTTWPGSSSTSTSSSSSSSGSGHHGNWTIAPQTNTGGSYGNEPEAYVPYGGNPEPQYGGYSNANEQLAASLQDAGAVTSGALGGQALWTSTPPGFYGSQYPDQYGLPENQYYSSFAEGTQAYSPTGIIEITGPGALYENGQLVWGEPADYNVINPYGGGVGGGGGGGGWGYGYGGGYGGGGGGGGGGYIEQELPPQGNQGERWGSQTPWQQMMINTHAGKGFQQGYARGGIVSLVE